MNISGRKIILRAIEETDLNLLHKWANDVELQSIIGNIHFPSSMLFHKEWLKKIQNDTLNQRFAIIVPHVGLIGLSTLMNINWRNNRAWHGIMIGNVDVRGRGYGYDAVMATMRYAFDELHFERLDTQMIEYNIKSIEFYCNKLGWKKEGVQRRWYFTKGRYWDRIICGITHQDYSELLERTHYWTHK